MVMLRTLSGFTTFIILAACCMTSSALGDTRLYAAYEIEIDAELETLRIKVCFSDTVPAYLYATSENAYRYLLPSKIGKDLKLDLDANPARMIPGSLVDNNCLEYSVDPGLVVAGRRRPGSSHNLDRDNLLVPLSAWLWLPGGSTAIGEIEITFRHTPGISVSAPWPLLRQTDMETVYRFVSTPPGWGAYTAFGRFNVVPVQVPGADLRVGLMTGTPQMKSDAVRDWIAQGATAITMAYGRFPLPSPQLLVVPLGRGTRGPVPWGQVLRGGGTAAHIFIDQTRPIEEHRFDWTLIHELSHMLHPYMGNSGSWLAEGLASYYQNVLQSRIGTLTEKRAWEKLHEGFQRGISQTYRGVTLEEASSNRRRGRRQTMRVYWSGAAMALLADLSLRKEGLSLDYAMSEFQRCCLPAGNLWSTDEYMAKLDELTGTTVFTILHDKYLYADEFPDMQEAYKELGLSWNKRVLTFTQESAPKKLRSTIMSPSMNRDLAELVP